MGSSGTAWRLVSTSGMPKSKHQSYTCRAPSMSKRLLTLLSGRNPFGAVSSRSSPPMAPTLCTHEAARVPCSAIASAKSRSDEMSNTTSEWGAD